MVSFHFIIDNQGNRVYDDSDVQLAYINLGRLSDFILNCQIKTELEYTNICQNVSADGDTNTTSDFLINLLVGGFEFMGDIEFPWVGKTGGKIAGWLLSALVDTWRSAPPPSLQNDFNNVWNGTKQAYDEAKLDVDTWRENLDETNGPQLWTKEFKCPKDGSIVTISQLSTVGYLPDSNTPEFDSGSIAVANQSKYLMNKILVPTRWKYVNTGNDNWWDCYYTRWNDSYPYDGPHYDGLSIQYIYGVYTSFPDMDVVDAQTNANHYIYFSKEDTQEYDHNWFSNDKLYKGTKYRRWNLTNKYDNIINNHTKHQPLRSEICSLVRGTAPESLINYLFNDGPGGNKDNGITSHDDVFNNWNLDKN
jgi:hypothetical protein